jgi:hypothetical protein
MNPISEWIECQNNERDAAGRRRIKPCNKPSVQRRDKQQKTIVYKIKKY